MQSTQKLLQERILVLGAGGQVGRALTSLLRSHPSVISLSRAEADLARIDDVLAQLERHRPTVVLNAAAYTQVDRAETERDMACAINGEAPALLAEWCFQNGATLVHYSTDYVFPGTGEQPWTEKDTTAPPNFYGESKRIGEVKILQEAATVAGLEEVQPRYLIFRTSWVYDSEGKNFLLTMLRLGKDKETLSIVADQIGAPTYAPDLAQATLQALENALEKKEFPSGIYHLCGGGQTSWYEFASEIFQLAKNQGVELKIKSLQKIATADYPTPAKRPLNSRMNTDLANKQLGVRLRDWRQALKDCVELITKGPLTS